jgi:hypothetical protein
MTGLIGKLQEHRVWLIRGMIILIMISPYKKCMREEKLENAFVGVGDDEDLRAKTCTRRVRKLRW